MKNRIFWVPLAVLALVAAGFYFYQRGKLPLLDPPARGRSVKQRVDVEPPPPAVTLVTPPVPAIRMPPITLPPIKLPAPPEKLAPEMVLPLQDQATIDFSIGSPVIKRDGSDAAALERALKEMEEATKNLVIPGTKGAAPQ